MKARKQVSEIGATTGSVNQVAPKWINDMFEVGGNTKANPSFQKLSEGAKSLALLILEHTPAGVDQKEAVQNLYRSFTTAKTAIQLGNVTI